MVKALNRLTFFSRTVGQTLYVDRAPMLLM